MFQRIADWAFSLETLLAMLICDISIKLFVSRLGTIYQTRGTDFWSLDFLIHGDTKFLDC